MLVYEITLHLTDGDLGLAEFLLVECTWGLPAGDVIHKAWV